MDKKVRGRTAHLTREMVTVGIAMRSQWHKHTLGSQCTEGNPWRDEKGGKRKLLLIPGSRLERLKADETIPAKERASAALLCGELGE